MKTRVAIATRAMRDKAILIGHREPNSNRVSNFEDTRNLWFGGGNKNSRDRDFRDFKPSEKRNNVLDETKVIELSDGDIIIYSPDDVVVGDKLIFLTQNKCGTPTINFGAVTKINLKSFFVGDQKIKKHSAHFVKIVPTLATSMNLSGRLK